MPDQQYCLSYEPRYDLNLTFSDKFVHHQAAGSNAWRDKEGKYDPHNVLNRIQSH